LICLNSFRSYQLFTNDIGINAGTIWHLLAARGAPTITVIRALTSHKDLFIYSALGCLSHENKIRFFEKDDGLYVELNQTYPEFYY
jgi:hypothetical protein